jgi:hypothetical protein
MSEEKRIKAINDIRKKIDCILSDLELGVDVELIPDELIEIADEVKKLIENKEDL